MQTTFFKYEGGAFSAKLGNEFAQVQESQLGECVGKIVTFIVNQTYAPELVAVIEKDKEHQDFSAYWALVNTTHTLVHDDLTAFMNLLKGN
jgi:hypothetical protein